MKLEKVLFRQCSKQACVWDLLTGYAAQLQRLVIEKPRCGSDLALRC